MSKSKIIAYRASILHFLSEPLPGQEESSYQYFADGLLVIERGKVKQLGDARELLKKLRNKGKEGEFFELKDYSGYLITPGFIDPHIHYPQTEIIASYGGHLLDWLNNYVYAAEKKYFNKEYALKSADFFFAELLRNGTTTAAVYSTVHANSVDAFFESAARLNMLMLTGKVLMDRNAPQELLDTPEQAYTETKNLIEKWHSKGRALYVITPRFAPTSTPEQLEVVGALKKEFPSTYIQTHISENRAEVALVKKLFPWSKDYTDVYDKYGILGKRSLFGHGIYLAEREFERFRETDSVLVWCPSSNFFLGSGLFNLALARKHKIRMAIATDMGGGSSFSMLKTLGEAYKVAVLDNLDLSPFTGFYRITLGNAKALALDDNIGNFAIGKAADFVVLDLNSTPLLADKMHRADNLHDKLFNLSILGDDRNVISVYIQGILKYTRQL